MSKPVDSTDLCREIVELIPLYVSGAIEPEDAIKLESHIDSCKSCSSELEFEKSLQKSVVSYEEKEIDAIMQRNLASFSSRLDADISNAASNAANSETHTQADNRSSSGGLLHSIGDFLKSIVPSGNPAMGGAFAMGLAVLVGAGVLLNSPSYDQIPNIGSNPEDFVRSCGDVEGSQTYEFTIEPAKTSDLQVEQVTSIANEYLEGNEIDIIQSGNNLVLTMTGEACDQRVPQLLQSLKSQPETVKSVTLKNTSIN